MHSLPRRQLTSDMSLVETGSQRWHRVARYTHGTRRQSYDGCSVMEGTLVIVSCRQPRSTQTVNVVLQPDAEGSDTADVGSLSLHEHHEWDHRSCVKTA